MVHMTKTPSGIFFSSLQNAFLRLMAFLFSLKFDDDDDDTKPSTSSIKMMLGFSMEAIRNNLLKSSWTVRASDRFTKSTIGKLNAKKVVPDVSGRARASPTSALRIHDFPVPGGYFV